jgi:hypothetical protein
VIFPVAKEPEAEPNYQKMVANGVAAHLPNRASFGPMEISSIRRTRLTEPGDWMVCVKTSIEGRDAYFGVL